ncbi:MAG: MFS transporter, partial [Bacillota bacterium]
MPKKETGLAKEAPFPWRALLILVIGPFMAILDGSIVNVAVPRLMAIFGVNTDKIQWVLTAYLLTSGVVIPVSGYLGDVFGYRRMYILSLGSFTLGSLLCALAWSNSSLIAARV